MSVQKRRSQPRKLRFFLRLDRISTKSTKNIEERPSSFAQFSGERWLIRDYLLGLPLVRTSSG